MASSSWLHFPRGRFHRSTCSWKIDAASWLARTLFQNLWVDPPVGIGRLVPPPWCSAFSRLCTRRYIFETALGLFGIIQFRALVLGRSPCSVDSCLGCTAAQKRILSVPCTNWRSFSARGVRVGLLRGSMPRTPHSHSSIDLSWSILLLSVLYQYLEGYASGNPRGLPRLCPLPLIFCLAIFLGLTAGSSLGVIRLIC